MSMSNKETHNFKLTFIELYRSLILNKQIIITEKNYNLHKERLYAKHILHNYDYETNILSLEK
jgi:hypothetical protein